MAKLDYNAIWQSMPVTETGDAVVEWSTEPKMHTGSVKTIKPLTPQEEEELKRTLEKINREERVYEDKYYGGKPVSRRTHYRDTEADQEDVQLLDIRGLDDTVLITLNDKLEFKIADGVKTDDALAGLLSFVSQYATADKARVLETKSALIFCAAALRTILEKVDISGLGDEDKKLLEEAVQRSQEPFTR